MSAQRPQLVDLAASVADGTADIDWDALESSLQTDEDRQMLRDLKVLAGISDLHRHTDGAPRPRGQARRPKVVGRIGPAPEADAELPTIEEHVLPQRSKSPTEFWGHLALLEQIGHGSFGDVFRAQDTRLDRDVALKLLRPGRATSELAAKMLHEGRILASACGWNTSADARSNSCCGRRGHSVRERRPSSGRNSAAPWPPSTRPGWCIATSRRRTSCAKRADAWC
jgi:hypothetical protein